MPAIWYKVRMSHRQSVMRSASIGAYFLSAFTVLYWFAGHGSLRSTFILSLACTIWDLFACVVGTWLAQNMMKLRTAAPLLAGAIACVGLASMTFWIYRGYGHFLFEGTWGTLAVFSLRALALPLHLSLLQFWDSSLCYTGFFGCGRAGSFRLQFPDSRQTGSYAPKDPLWGTPLRRSCVTRAGLS